MGEGVSLVDGYGVRNTITRVEHDTGGTSRGIEREHSLDGNVHSWSVEGLEHDLGHLLTVSLGVEGSLSQKYWVLFWGNTQLVVEGVMPDLQIIGERWLKYSSSRDIFFFGYIIFFLVYLLHIIPVCDNSVLDGVLQGKDTSLALSLVSHIGVLLTHADHHALVARTADDGREDSPGSIVSSKPGFAHTRSIINNQRSYIIITHLCSVLSGSFSSITKKM